MTTADLHEGLAVRYKPPRVSNYHPECEDGVVVDWQEVATDRVLVSVKYRDSIQSTALENLRPR